MRRALWLPSQNQLVVVKHLPAASQLVVVKLLVEAVSQLVVAKFPAAKLTVATRVAAVQRKAVDFSLSCSIAAIAADATAAAKLHHAVAASQLVVAKCRVIAVTAVAIADAALARRVADFFQSCSVTSAARRAAAVTQVATADVDVLHQQPTADAQHQQLFLSTITNRHRHKAMKLHQCHLHRSLIQVQKCPASVASFRPVHATPADQAMCSPLRSFQT